MDNIGAKNCMDELTKDILDRITKYRIERGWKNCRMATEAKISTSTVQSWYKNRARPELPAIQKLCVAFGITLVEFFSDGEKRLSLTEQQEELQNEFDLLSPNEKETVLALIKTMNENRNK